MRSSSRSRRSFRSSSNYAKINYVSPRLFGIQVGASFTPQTVRTPLPFTGNPSDGPNQQHALWEIAASYTGYFSGVAVGVTGGFAHGKLKNRTDGHDDLFDWAVGTQLAYSFDDAKISVGGAYRGTNAYLLDIGRRAATRARAWCSSRRRSRNRCGSPAWSSRMPISKARSTLPSPDFSSRPDTRSTPICRSPIGWQHYDYSRNAGAFYNGLSEIGMNAGFLSLGYTL